MNLSWIKLDDVKYCMQKSNSQFFIRIFTMDIRKFILAFGMYFFIVQALYAVTWTVLPDSDTPDNPSIDCSPPAYETSVKQGPQVGPFYNYLDNKLRVFYPKPNSKFLYYSGNKAYSQPHSNNIICDSSQYNNNDTWWPAQKNKVNPNNNRCYHVIMNEVLNPQYYKNNIEMLLSPYVKDVNNIKEVKAIQVHHVNIDAGYFGDLAIVTKLRNLIAHNDWFEPEIYVRGIDNRDAPDNDVCANLVIEELEKLSKESKRYRVVPVKNILNTGLKYQKDESIDNKLVHKKDDPIHSGVAHRKKLEVEYDITIRMKDGEERCYTLTVVTNGSYNMTLAAWRDNEESIIRVYKVGNETVTAPAKKEKNYTSKKGNKNFKTIKQNKESASEEEDDDDV